MRDAGPLAEDVTAGHLSPVLLQRRRLGRRSGSRADGQRIDGADVNQFAAVPDTGIDHHAGSIAIDLHRFRQPLPADMKTLLEKLNDYRDNQ